MSVIVEALLDDGSVVVAELQDNVVEVVVEEYGIPGAPVFIQQNAPTPEQTVGLSIWEWVELNPDGTVKTRWVGTP